MLTLQKSGRSDMYNVEGGEKKRESFTNPWHSRDLLGNMIRQIQELNQGKVNENVYLAAKNQDHYTLNSLAA